MIFTWFLGFDLGVFKEKPFGEDLTLAVLPESWRSVDATSSTTDTETVTPLEEMVSMSAGKSAACMRLPQTYPQNRPRRAMRPPKKYSPSPFKHRPIIRKRL